MGRVASALCGDPLYKNSTPGFDFSLCVCPAAHTSTARELALFKTTLNIRHLFLKTRGAEVRGLGSASPQGLARRTAQKPLSGESCPPPGEGTVSWPGHGFEKKRFAGQNPP